VQLTFLGSGDAFASGGRLHACFFAQGRDATFLIDCGPGVLPALQRRAINSGVIDFVLLSHLHGDHIAGVPFLLLHAKFVDRRTRPLTLAGPPGTGERLATLADAMYPGTLDSGLPFELRVLELDPGRSNALAGVDVVPFLVDHPSGAPAFGLRIECGGRTLAYSGDTGWTEALLELARDVDLFVCECSFFDTRVPNHLDHRRLVEERQRFSARRWLLTHLGAEVLERRSEVAFECAEDGLTVEV
jgi:ribonuclease BN (tRNA processing enzyme)